VFVQQVFQEFQKHQEFHEFQGHFKSISRDSKSYQEFQEHVSRVTNEPRLNSVFAALCCPPWITVGVEKSCLGGDCVSES